MCFDTGMGAVVEGNCEPDEAELLLNMRRIFEAKENPTLVSELKELMTNSNLVDAKGQVIMPIVHPTGSDFFYN